MAKRFHKIRYNEQTLRMEEIPFAPRDYVFMVLRKTAIFLAICAGSIYVFDTYFESPSDRTQRRELAKT
jgi:hypothetical protein